MTTSQTLPELVYAARTAAKASQDRILAILEHAQSQPLSVAQVGEVASETVAIELAAVDIFTVFEARMQRHFKRGPLSRKVEARLSAAGHDDLANRLHQYYLAINVLKHGTGTSHRELLSAKTPMFAVLQAAEGLAVAEGAPSGLIDVMAPRFFDGLADTILEAFQFLENGQG